MRHEALRLIFGIGDRLAPGRAARVAGDPWFTPPRRRLDRRPDRRPPDGTDFAIDVGAASVRGTTWGESGPWVYFMHGWGGLGDDVAPLVDLCEPMTGATADPTLATWSSSPSSRGRSPPCGDGLSSGGRRR